MDDVVADPVLELEPWDPTDADLDRELIRREGLYRFGQLAWPLVERARPFVDSRQARCLCAFLEDVGPGETVVINVPPGTGKSLWCSVFFPAWHAAFRSGDPRFDGIPTRSARFMAASFSDNLIRRDSNKHRALVDSSWYGAVTGIGVDHDEKNVETEWNTTAGGGRISATTGGPFTGRHADVCIVDDPIKPEDAHLDRAELERIIRWWTETMPSRMVRAARAVRIIVMQRLHQRDLAGYELDRGARSLVLPMRFEPNHPHRSKLDWRTEPGELLCPELKDLADVDKAEEQMSDYAVAGQEQQRPAPEGGGIFKLEWLGERWRQQPADGVWIQSWDFSFKGETTSDWVCGGVWCAHGNYLDKVHQVRGKWGFVESLEQLALVSEDWPQATTCLIEDKANGTAIMNAARAAAELYPALARLDLIPVEPEGGKEARAWASQTKFKALRVRVPMSAPWVEGWVDELKVFPAGANDDQVDETTQAINYLAGEGTQSYEAFVKALSDSIRPPHMR